MTPAKKAPPAPFARPGNTDDGEGTVWVTITRKDSGRFVKGNISRTFTVPATKVSTVAQLIERTLFGEPKK